MKQQDLKQFVQNNPKLVTMRECGGFPGLFVLKYKRNVFYDNLWNDFLEECRGTIVDADFNVVSRPFTKIYNFRVENKSPKLSDDTKVTAYRKINGFMCAVTWYDGRLLVSTTGSTENDYVNMAKEMMKTHMSMEAWEHMIRNHSGNTLMFECVHPNDPHIVPEKPGLYFLGVRSNTWEDKVDGFGLERSNIWRVLGMAFYKTNLVESFQTTVGEMVAMSKTARHEGFVFYTADGVSAKIKTPHYLTAKWMARNPRTDKLLTKEFKEQIDEEFYPCLDHIRENIVEFTALTEQDRLAWIRAYLEKQ
jgi:hypothetical protein